MENKNNNRLIARFMGYGYYHPEVYIDYSDIGGLYEPYEVFSKVPILTTQYCDSNPELVCFAELPNPDYGKENPKKWRSDLETLGWNSINSGKYIVDLKYHQSWDALMPAVGLIMKMYRSHKKWPFDQVKGPIYSVIKDALVECNFDELYKAVIEFLNIYFKDFSKYIGCYVKRHWAPFEKDYMYKILDWTDNSRYSEGEFLYDDGCWRDVEDSIMIVDKDIYGNDVEYRELNVHDERYVEKYYNPYAK